MHPLFKNGNSFANGSNSYRQPNLAFSLDLICPVPFSRASLSEGKTTGHLLRDGELLSKVDCDLDVSSAQLFCGNPSFKSLGLSYI